MIIVNKYGFVFFVVFSVFLVQRERLSAQNIPWREGVSLKWEDFKGIADTGDDFAAQTHYSLGYKYGWSSDGTTSVTVECVFDENKSWKKNSRELTPELLRHEQLHFDVAELFARKMRAAYDKYVNAHKHNTYTTADIKEIFETTMKECANYNDLYDAETEHSLIEGKQQEWDRKITDELARFSKYASK